MEEKQTIKLSKIRRWIRTQRTAIRQSYNPRQKYNDWDKGYSDCLSELNEYLEQEVK
jgi:hypothetical protein